MYKNKIEEMQESINMFLKANEDMQERYNIDKIKHNNQLHDLEIEARVLKVMSNILSR